MTPDGPHGEELAGLVLFIADVQRHASAHVVVAPWKGSLPQILALAVLFVFSVLALYVVVAEELLLQADISPGPHPVSCSAHQVVPTISILSKFDLSAAVLTSDPFRSALTGCGTCAPVQFTKLRLRFAGLFVPERLVGTKLRIDRLPSCSRSLELVAGAWGAWKTP